MESLIKLKRSVGEFLDSDSGYAKATKVAFAVLLVAGVLTVAAMAPNIFVALGKRKRFNRYSDKQLRNAYYGLKRQGLVEVIKEEDDNLTIKLNYKNQAKIRKFALDVFFIPKLKQWDKKWRVIIFDVPVQYNRARIAMARKLKELGLYQLQKSVWVYPFPCEDEILFVANFFKVDRFVNILIADNIINDYNLKNFFDLT
jgi:DNA-binding transcriptional regulator PaaX